MGRPNQLGRGETGGADHAPTREMILTTAEALFSARGFDGVAVRDLARALDLTPSSLYNHFPSKQALYDAVLERGIRPIADLVAAAWQPGALRPDRIHATVDGLVSHLAGHPHLARLVQRALLAESDNVVALIGRWLAPLYGSGVTAIRNAAKDAGWRPEEMPHLVLGLFGLVFTYFVNTATMQALTTSSRDPLSRPALLLQRRFLEEAIYRLLGPRPDTSKKSHSFKTDRENSE